MRALRSLQLAFATLALLALTACGPPIITDTTPRPTATLHPLAAPSPTAPSPAPGIRVVVDATRDSHPISPLIYGVSGAGRDILSTLRPTVNSWGGNPSSRYNWEHGTAWNAARDWYYMNVDYTRGEGGSASDRHIENSLEHGAEVRMSLPTLGWVARDNDNRNCSFPNPDGSCGVANMATCRNRGAIADPTRTSQPSDVAFIRRWVEHMIITRGYDVRFFAMDNEPELWGETHYDVHPACTTYEEILTTYLTYATMVREVAPQSELLGPVTCCWYYYWNSAAGPFDRQKHGNQPFLPWFLNQVRKHDRENGVRTLDVLDIHYYPETVFRGGDDPAIAAQRIRAARSLWDRSYIDESWINEPVYLIPRMRELIARHYPGLKLAISEWNFGGEQHISGAIAVAEVLGIFGREDLYMASYWTYPPPGSPAFYAFKLYTNYNDAGGRFGDRSIGAWSSAPEHVSAYAALDGASGALTLMLINKDLVNDQQVTLELRNLSLTGVATLYRYGASTSVIMQQPFELASGARVTLPVASITLLVVQPA